MTGSLPVTALDYDLPGDLVATAPAEPRDAARLMVVHRGEGRIEHRTVRDLPEYLGAGDRLVLNDTAVAAARLVGRRADTGGRVEGLFLHATAPDTFEAMLKSNGRLRPGQQVLLAAPATAGAGGADSEPSLGGTIELLERTGPTWIVQVVAGAVADLLESAGRTPLPPYILRARGERHLAIDDPRDPAWYQTVFADLGHRASVAAPTAGLHFTPELLERLDAAGVRRLAVTLDVGVGTFKPIETETVEAHPMHTERFRVPATTIDALRGATAGRTVAVGTTAVRALESLPEPLPGGVRERSPEPDAAWAGETGLLIAPGFRFRLVDALLTNFHLPRSTLLALVAAMTGLERMQELYRVAVAERYRFYSYGDAMLIL